MCLDLAAVVADRILGGLRSRTAPGSVPRCRLASGIRGKAVAGWPAALRGVLGQSD